MSFNEDDFLGNIPDFADDYTSDQRRKIIRNTLSQLIWEGYSQTSALQVYQDKGLGIKSSDFAQIYNKQKDFNQFFSSIAILRDDEKPTDEHFLPSTYELTAKYRLTAFVTYRNATSEQVEQTFISLDTNKLKTMGQMEQSIYDLWTERYNQTEGDALDITIIYGLINTF